MANLFNRYIWIIDTIRRHGRITRNELAKQWLDSPISEKTPLTRRTFFNYRNSILELFGVNIECDPATYEYYIDNTNPHNKSLTDWMLNTAAVGNIVVDASDIPGKIFVEDVPSARQYLSLVIKALKERHPVKFDYLPYTRVYAQRGIVVEPYFLKIFRQRWYLTGMNVKDATIKTYCLDRMSEVTISGETFEEPAGFNAEEFCRDSFGIMFTHGKVYDIAIRVESGQAKYLRGLPLHPSQREMVHDDYSIFYYKMRLSGDLVAEILSRGPEMTVLAPTELRAMVQSKLKAALEKY